MIGTGLDGEGRTIVCNQTGRIYRSGRDVAHENLTRLPKRGSYVGQTAKFVFVLVMVGFAMSVAVQFSYWMAKHFNEVVNYSK